MSINFGGGTISYNIKNNSVYLEIEKLQNNRNGGKSGSLRVYLTTLDYYYKSGSISGPSHTDICWFQMDPLEGGYYYSNIQKNCDRISSKTRNFMAMIIMEYNNNKWNLEYVAMFEPKIESMLESQIIRDSLDQIFQKQENIMVNAINSEKQRLKRELGIF